MVYAASRSGVLAVNAEAALAELDAKWGARYPAIIRSASFANNQPGGLRSRPRCSCLGTLMTQTSVGQIS